MHVITKYSYGLCTRPQAFLYNAWHVVENDSILFSSYNYNNYAERLLQFT